MLHDQVALVIGASTGIGRATALTLAARGARVAAVARSGEALSTLSAEIRRAGGSAMVLATDVLAPGAVEDAVRRVWDELGTLDILVYAAGYMPLQSMDLGEAGWRRTFGVNLEGFVQACDAATAAWIEHKRSGTILSVSSVGADDGVIVPHLESYAASKAALTQYTRCLAATWARYGIRANCIQPGIVRTPMAAWVGPEFQSCWTAQMPLGRVCEPEEIARAIAFLVSPAAAYITGEALKVDGGFALGQLPALLRP